MTALIAGQRGIFLGFPACSTIGFGRDSTLGSLLRLSALENQAMQEYISEDMPVETFFRIDPRDLF